MEIGDNGSDSASDSSVTFWVRESHMDVLLAESFSTEPEFLTWFLAQIFDDSIRSDQIESSRTSMNVNRSITDGMIAASGETDLLLEFTLHNGQMGVISIENKIASAPQPEQGHRHRLFVDARSEHFRRAVVIAPRRWLDGHPTECSHYHASVSLEAIATWHDNRPDRAAQWRGAVLRRATAQANTPEPAPDLDVWTSDFADLLGQYGLELAPQQRRRTVAPGSAKSSRTIWCAPETLRDHSDFTGLDALLLFRHASANHPGRVAIDITISKTDPRAHRFAAEGQAAGFDVRQTAATLMIESRPPAARTFNMTEEPSAQKDAIAALAAEAIRLRDWWNKIAHTGLRN